jgi:cell division protein FtsB
MNALDQIAQLQKLVKKLRKENTELKQELNFRKQVEMEAVKRYGKVADELLVYYLEYGRIDFKERKRQK